VKAVAAISQKSYQKPIRFDKSARS
jgi:hypothetical protein